MDKEIRQSVNSAILEIEAHLRTALSYTVAKYYTADQELYLKRENYERGDDKFKTSQRDKLLKNAIKFYKTTHIHINIIEKNMVIFPLGF